MIDYTKKETKAIQNIMEGILKRGQFIYTSSDGLCYEISRTLNAMNDRSHYKDKICTDVYALIETLMDNKEHGYIGEETGLNPERVMFLILCTTISAQDFNDWANAA